jgi:hypothetical protein
VGVFVGNFVGVPAGVGEVGPKVGLAMGDLVGTSVGALVGADLMLYIGLGTGSRHLGMLSGSAEAPLGSRRSNSNETLVQRRILRSCVDGHNNLINRHVTNGALLNVPDVTLPSGCFRTSSESNSTNVIRFTGSIVTTNVLLLLCFSIPNTTIAMIQDTSFKTRRWLALDERPI